MTQELSSHIYSPYPTFHTENLLIIDIWAILGVNCFFLGGQVPPNSDFNPFLTNIFKRLIIYDPYCILDPPKPGLLNNVAGGVTGKGPAIPQSRARPSPPTYYRLTCSSNGFNGRGGARPHRRSYLDQQWRTQYIIHGIYYSQYTDRKSGGDYKQHLDIKFYDGNIDEK
jgi:hypothetical protein